MTSDKRRRDAIAVNDSRLIREMLSTLAYGEATTWIQDRLDRQWQVRILGTENRHRKFFWRPDCPLPAQAADLLTVSHAAHAYTWHASRHSGTWLHFDSPLHDVLHLMDGSLLMISPFPALFHSGGEN